MSETRTAVQTGKRALRRKYCKRRAALDDAERSHASLRIAEFLAGAPYFRSSRRIACYLPMPDEVDTWPIIQRAWRRKKRIFAPLTGRDGLLTFREVTPDTDLVRTDWGLLEPVHGETISARQLDLVLTPLVAFDAERRRIGLGGGYYDRTFAFLGQRRLYFRPKLVGLAFDCQHVEKIATNPWDIALYRVITESREQR